MTLVLPDKKRPIAVDLRGFIGTEKVRDDVPALTASAIDASLYKIVPKAIVLAASRGKCRERAEASALSVAAYPIRRDAGCRSLYGRGRDVYAQGLDTAQKIFDRKRRAIEASGADIVATSCPACLIQLENGLRGEVVVKHVAELVSDAHEMKAEAGEGMPSHS